MPPVPVPGRRSSIRHRITHCPRLTRGYRPHGDSPEVIRRRLRIGQPFGIGRPHEPHTAPLEVGATDIGCYDFPSRYLHYLDPDFIVIKSDPFPVRRPTRLPPQLRIPDRDLSRFRFTFLIGDV